MTFGTLVDRLPRIRELAATKYHSAVVSGVRQLLTELSDCEQDAVVRGVLRQRAFNRIIHSFHTCFPRIAVAVARGVPIAISTEVSRLLQSDRPVLVAGPHIGPVFFALTVLLTVLRGRSVFVLHASKTHFSQINAKYLHKIGVRSVLQDDNSLRTLAHALRTERRCTVIIGFDHLAHGRHKTTLFHTPLAVSYGIAYLADVSKAAVIITCWDFARRWPRLAVEGPHEIDRALTVVQRRDQLMSRLFDHLEHQIRMVPEQWTEWQYVDVSRARLRLGFQEDGSSKGCRPRSSVLVCNDV
jgi:lauroyl/myristoyl acyltransferase